MHVCICKKMCMYGKLLLIIERIYSWLYNLLNVKLKKKNFAVWLYLQSEWTRDIDASRYPHRTMWSIPLGYTNANYNISQYFPYWSDTTAMRVCSVCGCCDGWTAELTLWKTECFTFVSGDNYKVEALLWICIRFVLVHMHCSI